MEQAGAGDVVPPEDPEALAALWSRLANDRSLLATVDGLGAAWVQKHADPDNLADRYLSELERLRHRGSR